MERCERRVKSRWPLKIITIDVTICTVSAIMHGRKVLLDCSNTPLRHIRWPELLQ